MKLNQLFCLSALVAFGAGATSGGGDKPGHPDINAQLSVNTVSCHGHVERQSGLLAGSNVWSSYFTTDVPTQISHQPVKVGSHIEYDVLRASADAVVLDFSYQATYVKQFKRIEYIDEKGVERVFEYPETATVTVHKPHLSLRVDDDKVVSAQGCKLNINIRTVS